jgi:hypothetical protein
VDRHEVNPSCALELMTYIAMKLKVFKRMPAKPPVSRELDGKPSAERADLDDPVGRLKSWASRMAQAA